MNEAKDEAPDIDALMRTKLYEMRIMFEPKAIECSHDLGEVATISTAISLKRIADALWSTQTAINAIPGEITKVYQRMDVNTMDIKNALYTVSTEIRNTAPAKFIKDY